MKSKLFFALLVVAVTGFSSLFAQGFQPPSEGKAVVYIVRVSSYGGATSFEYFHQDKYIGIFKGVNYLRYECDPGAHLFWASSENKEFITADLEAGKTYVILVDIIMGMWKAQVGLRPVTVNDAELFERVKKVVTSRKETITPQEKIDAMNEKLKDFIPEQLNKYETQWKGNHNYKHISAEMFIPEESMK
jgi:hypothetical protein